MKNQILTLIIGMLIGAILTAGVFLFFRNKGGDYRDVDMSSMNERANNLKDKDESRGNS